ncbi:MAG: UbiA family prenyltransferase [Kiritimatiellae bacterium]|nr:UbiA family prenyltransferase [Kiritimatiellia bacterium]
MRVSAYIKIARPDYWANNVFILPGILLVFLYAPHLRGAAMWLGILGGLASACLVASSNYVLNEILDAPKDAYHPEKAGRPIPSGLVRVPVAYIEWLLLAAAGFALAFSVNDRLGCVALFFWLAGMLYNVPPFRLKDIAYLDVLSESVNNPIRFCIGWYSTGHDIQPPLSIIMAYWMFGAFLMAMKRYAEYRHIADPARAALYRKSFGHYTEERLLESLCFYGALFGMLSGIFMARYHIEVVLATPLVALAMAYYMHLAFKPNSPTQHPERLYRQRKLMLLVALAFLSCVFFLFADVPLFRRLIAPRELPPGQHSSP